MNDITWMLLSLFFLIVCSWYTKIARERENAVPGEYEENREVMVGGHLKFNLDMNEPVDSNFSAEYIKEWLLQRYQARK